MKTHILLIDDDIDEIKTFVTALKEVVESFKCSYASHGIHALRMLFYLRPAGIFAHSNMPAMNGLEFIEEIKRDEQLRSIPMFLYSRHTSPDTIQRAENTGVAGCMEKPASMEGLIKPLKAVFTTTI